MIPWQGPGTSASPQACAHASIYSAHEPHGAAHAQRRRLHRGGQAGLG